MKDKKHLVEHDKIKKLNDREKARDKIAIWYGGKENYQHGLKEVIANATDEIINNFETGSIMVELFKDYQTIQVTDSGRGIPIDGETDGIKNYELLFTTLFAGTKYETNDNNTTGTNGVGTTVLNYTSIIFEVESYYNGFKHSIKFGNGGEIIEDLKKEKCSLEEHGTVITFKLDPEIYPTTTYIKEEVQDIVKRFSVSTSKVTLTFIHDDEEEEFHYDSTDDYFKETVHSLPTSPIKTLPSTMYEDDGEKTEVKLILTTMADPIQESYLNLTYLPEGGAINEGIILGVKNFANKYCKDNRLFPKGVTGFATSDIESSISFVCVVFSNNVEFKNQTKLSTNKNLYKKISSKHAFQLLEIYKIEDESGLKKLINHMLTIQKHNTASLKAKAALKAKLSEKVEGIGNKVLNLVDCKKHGLEAEIFIAEGASALGSIVLARDALYQAAFPLRGKILNCLKADYTTIFENKIITDLVKVLGCGIQTDKKNKDLENFDLKKLRYGKIIIATDADDDGYQIAALIITMIYRLMPQLLTEGYIYIAQTPLYELKMDDDRMIYFYSEDEKNKKLPSIKGKYTLSRVKGLGELAAETMAETAMDKDTRNLMKVNADDAKRMVDSLEKWMGISILGRKEFIENNLSNYVDASN